MPFEILLGRVDTRRGIALGYVDVSHRAHHREDVHDGHALSGEFLVYLLADACFQLLGPLEGKPAHVDAVRGLHRSWSLGRRLLRRGLGLRLPQPFKLFASSLLLLLHNLTLLLHHLVHVGHRWRLLRVRQLHGA